MHSEREVPFLPKRQRRRYDGLDIGTIALDRTSPRSLNDQLAGAIRDAILTGRLALNAKLPSTRLLARELNISRTTSSAAFDDLAAEGLIVSAVGSGTRVCPALPDGLNALDPAGLHHGRERRSRLTPRKASRLESFVRSGYAGIPRPFSPGVPGIDQFPIAQWTNLVASKWRSATVSELCRPVELGTRELCAAVARHAGASRGALCTAESIIIVNSTQQALSTAAAVLTEAGDVCWMENPGYASARYALTMAGLDLVPVPVDTEGMDVETAIANLPVPTLIYVTPSHQYPMGGTLSLERRKLLLEYADRTGAWIIEDDYDSEYVTGSPLLCLQGLDTSDRVVYTSSFNKTIFPNLRLGFMIVPSDLKRAFEAAQSYSGGPPPAVNQIILADFIDTGAFVSHLRRTRSVYNARRGALVESLQRHLPDLTLGVHDRGLHFVALLPDHVDDEAARSVAWEAGIIVTPLSRFYIGPAPRPGLLFGTACVPEIQIDPAVRRLAAALEPLISQAQPA